MRERVRIKLYFQRGQQDTDCNRRINGTSKLSAQVSRRGCHRRRGRNSTLLGVEVVTQLAHQRALGLSIPSFGRSGGNYKLCKS